MQWPLSPEPVSYVSRPGVSTPIKQTSSGSGPGPQMAPDRLTGAYQRITAPATARHQSLSRHQSVDSRHHVTSGAARAPLVHARWPRGRAVNGFRR